MKDKHIVMEIDLRVSPPRTIEDARIEAIETANRKIDRRMGAGIF